MHFQIDFLMFVLKYLVVVSVVPCTFGGKPNARIVGGKEAPMGKFPHQASLQQSGGHACSGTILSNRWLLSAAHCLDGSHPVVALVGTHNLDSGGTKYEIAQVFYHYLFNPPFAWNDIALLKTHKKIAFGQNISPIALGIKRIGAGVEVLLSGWGLITSPPDPLAEHQIVPQLRYVKLRTITNRECHNASFLPIGYRQICTLTKEGEGACFGDTGGALVNTENNRLIGILSRGTVPDKCGVGAPDVYMRVSSYIAWIKMHMIFKHNQ